MLVALHLCCSSPRTLTELHLSVFNLYLIRTSRRTTAAAAAVIYSVYATANMFCLCLKMSLHLFFFFFFFLKIVLLQADLLAGALWTSEGRAAAAVLDFLVFVGETIPSLFNFKIRHFILFFSPHFFHLTPV